MEGLVRYNLFTSKQVSIKGWIWLLVIVYAAIFLGGLRSYLQWQSVNLLLGVLSLGICSNINRQFTGSKRFGYLAFVLLVLLVIMPVKTMLYLAVLSGVCYLIESYYGRLNALPCFSLLIMSPFFQYLSNVFVFPIRLQLSEWAGALLNTMGTEVIVAGNILTVNAQEFSVDPACMGINMLVVSLLLSLMLIGIYQRKYGQQLRSIAIVAILLFTFVLNIVSNLVRILLLVKFSILPGEVMHDVTGMVCLLLYVFVPVAGLIKMTVPKIGVNESEKKQQLSVSLLPHILLACLHLLLTFKVVSLASPDSLPDPSAFVQKGYAAEPLVKEDVLKLKNDHALVYIKPIRNFFNADHNPMICWKGSGYELRKINTVMVGGIQVYTATLEKKGDLLYTSWWYDNGEKRTISQASWRWNMARGSDAYAIINVTCDSPTMLAAEIERVLSINKFIFGKHSG